MRGPWQGSLPVQKYFLLDNLFPFICFHLPLDQAGSPLIISVIPLPNPGQQICFSKVSGPEINWKEREILYFSCGWPERWLEAATNCVHFPLRPIIVHNSPWKVLKGNLDRKWSWGVAKATHEDSSWGRCKKQRRLSKCQANNRDIDDLKWYKNENKPIKMLPIGKENFS